MSRKIGSLCEENVQNRECTLCPEPHRGEPAGLGEVPPASGGKSRGLTESGWCVIIRLAIKLGGERRKMDPDHSRSERYSASENEEAAFTRRENEKE